jgi:hypothetical protein
MILLEGNVEATLFRSVHSETPIALGVLEDMACGLVPIHYRKQEPIQMDKNEVVEGEVVMRGGHAIPTDPGFEVKDSGVREEYENGFIRDTEEDKDDLTWLYELEGIELIPGEMLVRFVEHMRKGAVKYGPNNWTRAQSMEAVNRFRRSASRHYHQWMKGNRDEDHASAVVFNMWAAEVTLRKIDQRALTNGVS